MNRILSLMYLRSIQPWLQREDEDKSGHGEKQILQSVEDRAKVSLEGLNFLVIQRYQFSVNQCCGAG